MISFDSGRCALCATSEQLILLAEADDQHSLDLIKEALTTRLQRIGYRDQLALTWTSAAAQLSEPDRSGWRGPKES